MPAQPERQLRGRPPVQRQPPRLEGPLELRPDFGIREPAVFTPRAGWSPLEPVIGQREDPPHRGGPAESQILPYPPPLRSPRHPRPRDPHPPTLTPAQPPGFPDLGRSTHPRAPSHRCTPRHGGMMMRSPRRMRRTPACCDGRPSRAYVPDPAPSGCVRARRVAPLPRGTSST